MKAALKLKLQKIVLYSFLLGLVGIIGFILVDRQSVSSLSLTGAFFFGFAPGMIILCYEYFISSKYLKKIHGLLLLLINSAIYFVLITVLLVLSVVIFKISPDYEAGRIGVYGIIHHDDTRAGIILIGISVVILQFFLLLKSFLGKGILEKLILGTYHRPREVERIFMFLDVKASTSIAEKIGHLAFLSLLRDFFFDLSEVLAACKGEIYKYVGDEAIITWKVKKGSGRADCIHCFFMLKQLIAAKESYYKKKYGFVPEFKAGAHWGTVVIGEIGSEKKEITYLGDVLNTTARIEGECSRFEKEFVISGDLLELINLPGEYRSFELEKVKLRGKEQATLLYAIRETGQDG